MSDDRDDEGHLTYDHDGNILPGLCHCCRREAHYADERPRAHLSRAQRDELAAILFKGRAMWLFDTEERKAIEP